MKELGYGQGYRYAHDEPEAYAAGERYLPDEMPDRRYYRPVHARARDPDRRSAGAAARPRQPHRPRAGTEAMPGWMLVALGSALGGVARYAVAQRLPAAAGRAGRSLQCS